MAAWNLVSRVLTGQPARLAVVILNQPLASSFRTWWAAAAVRVVADGGSNQLRAFDASLQPDAVVGDLDSITAETRQHYEAQGVPVHHVPDQNSTDMEKALRHTLDVFHANEALDAIVVLGGLDGGRFDHVLGNINTAMRLHPLFPHIYMLGEVSWTVVLGKGSHTIECSALEGPECGLIPIGVPAPSVVTKGLKWELDESMPMQFGGLVSTSNRLTRAEDGSSTVSVTTATPLLFTTEYKLAQPAQEAHATDL